MTKLLFNRKVIFFITLLNILCFTPDKVFAGDGEFKPMKSLGNVPSVFTQQSSKVFESKILEIDKNQKKYEQKAQEDVHLRTSYAIHETLYDGRVLFGDPITSYLNKIADEILKNDPKTRSEINIFTYQSSDVNAVCFPNGVILVNTGLIAQVDNERELAFIIAHEISHYIKKHSLNEGVEVERMKRGKGKYKGLEDKDLEKHYFSYSREHEAEADVYGFELMKKTNYELEGVEDVFHVLKYSYLPYDDEKLDLAFFTYNNLILPTSAFLEELNKVDFADENEDPKSTHPSSEERRRVIEKSLKSVNTTSKQKNIAGEADFKIIQRLARFDLSNIYLMELNYAKAIYNSYSNIKNYGEDEYNNIVILKSFYALNRYISKNKLSNILESTSEITGEWQKIYHLAWNLSGKEFTALSAHTASNILLKYPNNVSAQRITEELISDLISEHDFVTTYFETRPYSETKIEFVPISEEEYNNLSRTDQIKYKKAENETKVEAPTFERYIFANIINESFVQTAFDKGRVKKDEKDRIANLSRSEKKKIKKQKDKEAKKPKSLGIDKIVMFNPEYTKQFKKKAKTNLKNTEEAEIKFNQTILNVADKVDLDIKLIDDNLKTLSNIDEINAYNALRKFSDERFHHLKNKVELLSLNQEELSQYPDILGTKYLATTGLYSEKRKVYGKFWICASGIFVYPILPFIIYDTYRPHYSTLYYYFLFDMQDGKPVWSTAKVVDDNDYSSLVNTLLYDSFNQTHKKAKK